MKLVTPSIWTAGEGPDADVVMSTRVRLARNLQEVTFIGRASLIQATEAAQAVQRAVARSESLRSMTWVDLTAITARDRALLVERGLVGEHFSTANHPRGMAVAEHGEVSVLANEEDHVRVQAVRPGSRVSEALEAASGVEQALGEHLPFAFHSRWGFLTACPTNVGTGLRVSVMANLPAMALTGQIPRLQRAAKELHLAIRGFRGEGTGHEADLFQVSNQITLGRSASELADDFSRAIVPELVEWERAARRAYLQANRWPATDRAAREVAMLQSARLMARDEAMKRLGRVRLGVSLGLIEGVSYVQLSSLMLRIQPEHLALECPAAGHGVEHDKRERARLLRDVFAPVSVSGSDAR